MGAADDADDPGLDPEMAEGLDQLAADRLLVARVGAGVLAPLFQHLRRRDPVVDLLRGRHSALLPHRRRRDNGLVGVRGHDLGLRLRIRLGIRLRLEIVELGVEVLGHRFAGGVVIGRLVLENRDRGRDRVLLGIGVHDVRGWGTEAALGLGPALGDGASELSGAVARLSQRPASCREEGRDRGPCQQQRSGDDQ